MNETTLLKDFAKWLHDWHYLPEGIDIDAIVEGYLSRLTQKGLYIPK